MASIFPCNRGDAPDEHFGRRRPSGSVFPWEGRDPPAEKLVNMADCTSPLSDQIFVYLRFVIQDGARRQKRESRDGNGAIDEVVHVTGHRCTLLGDFRSMTHSFAAFGMN